MRTKAPPNILDNIEIAKPCSAAWEDMAGDERVRDCSQCKLSVYNISEMSQKAAENLIVQREGRLCIRLYRRPDGTLITDECPVALRRIRNSLKNFTRTAAAALSCLISFSAAKASDDEQKSCGNTTVVAGKEQAGANPNSQVLQGLPAPVHREMGKIMVIKKSLSGEHNLSVPNPQGSSRVLMGEAEVLPKQASPAELLQSKVRVKPPSVQTLPEIKTEEYNSAVQSTNPAKKVNAK